MTRTQISTSSVPETLWEGVCWLLPFCHCLNVRAKCHPQTSIEPATSRQLRLGFAAPYGTLFLLASSQRPDSQDGKGNTCFLLAFSALAWIKGDLLLLNLEYTIIRRSEKICNWSEGQDGRVGPVVGGTGSRSLG